MNDELREMVREILNITKEVISGKIKFEEGQTKTDKVIKRMNAWHKSERKRWAMGLVGKEERIDDVNPGNLTLIAQIQGKNQIIREIRQKIEEEQ